MKQQKGISLVLLLVSMAIGTFLIAAMVQVFWGIKNNYRYIKNLTDLQNDVRFIETRLVEMIRYTGFISPPDNGNTYKTLEEALPAVTVGNPVGESLSAGTFLVPLQRADSDGTLRDGFLISMQGNRFEGTVTNGNRYGTVTNCRGDQIPKGQRVILLIDNWTNKNTITCSEFDGSNFTNQQTFSDGLIENFEVRYGKVENIGDKSIKEYFSAPRLSVSDREKLRAIRIKFIAKSPEAVISETENSNPFIFWGNALAPKIVNTNKLVREEDLSVYFNYLDLFHEIEKEDDGDKHGDHDNHDDHNDHNKDENSHDNNKNGHSEENTDGHNNKTDN